MDSLWKKESKNSELYVDIFKDVSTYFRDSCLANISEYILEKKHYAQKNNEKSLVFLTNGNKAFDKNDLLQAMKCYNASLCFAQDNSENISLAYANRSKCFLQLKMYKKCLIDIELARQAKYPTVLIPVLNERREECLEQMKGNDEFEEFVPKLSYDDNEKFPGLANVCKIEFDETNGRHIVATNDIPAGQTILVEHAFTSRLIGTQHINCSACLKTSMNFIACAHCTNALFCNSDCANANNFHKIECEEHSFDTKSPNEFYMRSIFTAMSIFDSIDDLVAFVEDTVNEKKKAPGSLTDMKSKYRALLQLSTFSSAENKNLYFQQAFMIYNSLILMKSIKKQFKTVQKKRFLMHLVFHHDIVISINNFRCGDYTTMEDEGAFIICSYFNHACAPNLMVKRIGKLRFCITTRPIKAGQQMYVTYFGDLFCTNEVRKCQEFLFRNFGFLCKCERCKPHNLSINARNLLSHPLYESLCIDMYKQPTDGYDRNKLMHLQVQFIELLNQYGENWCEALDAVIEDYESISDQIISTKNLLPLSKKSFNFHYISIFILVASIFIYFYSFN